jgi:hypothetical protein
MAVLSWTAPRIRRQMLSSPGAVGLSLIATPLHRAFWTRLPGKSRQR